MGLSFWYSSPMNVPFLGKISRYERILFLWLLIRRECGQRRQRQVSECFYYETGIIRLGLAQLVTLDSSQYTYNTWCTSVTNHSKEAEVNVAHFRLTLEKRPSRNNISFIDFNICMRTEQDRLRPCKSSVVIVVVAVVTVVSSNLCQLVGSTFFHSWCFSTSRTSLRPETTEK
jgi:hypothetical protein